MSTTNIYSKIMSIRNEFKAAEIKKSGHNAFQHFKYLELYDFVPLAIELCVKYGVYTHIDIGVDISTRYPEPNEGYYAVMTVINTEKPEEYVKYKIRMPEVKQDSNFNKTMQNMGGMETYLRRYLYLLFLDLAIPDTVDASNNKTRPKKTVKQLQQEKQAKKQSQKQEEETKPEYETQTVEPIHRPRQLNNDLQIDDPSPCNTILMKLIKMLEIENKEISKSNMRVKASQCHKNKKLINSPKQLKEVIDYINTHCPEEES